jgi:CRISPR-associated protein Csh1
MIQEIVNYTKHLKESSPWIFEHKLEPSAGVHIFIELDDEGKHINWPPEQGKDWDYYDGKETSSFLNSIPKLERYGQRIGSTMNKVLDKKKQIFSCSPFIVSFKKKSFAKTNLEGEGEFKIIKLLDFYFENADKYAIDEDDVETKQMVLNFKSVIKNVLPKLSILKTDTKEKDGTIKKVNIAEEMSDDFFINFYLKNATTEKYRIAHENYLKKNLFNTDEYNTDKIVKSDTFGLSGFYNGLNQKKPFLEHKTATPFKGISRRIQAKDTVYLNDFDNLLRRKVFPKPLPIFIDKNEFENGDDIIKVFKENEKLSFSQIIKSIFEKDENRELKNYYLLFFNYKAELKDFDFVSKFEYKLDECEIQNIFQIRNKEKELKQYNTIKTIFGFEYQIVRDIFNNALVNVKNDSYQVKYFDEIKAEYVSGGELVYQMILKYRKAFYEYIYKSKKSALNENIWDEIMWNTIIADLRNEQYFNILNKLNIWFSLYNFFNNNHLNRDNMASLIPELTEKMRKVANNDNVHFENEKEFAFGAGQIIYFLLTKSKSAERKHSMLEPFLQKVSAEQLQAAVANIFATYKHEIDFGQGRFESLAREVLAFKTDVNIKPYQRFLLAGYFAPPVIFEEKENNNQKS